MKFVNRLLLLQSCLFNPESLTQSLLGGNPNAKIPKQRCGIRTSPLAHQKNLQA